MGHVQEGQRSYWPYEVIAGQGASGLHRSPGQHLAVGFRNPTADVVGNGYALVPARNGPCWQPVSNCSGVEGLEAEEILREPPIWDLATSPWDVHLIHFERNLDQ